MKKNMTKNKHIDSHWSEWNEKSVYDDFQTELDKTDGTPPIVEYTDGYDF